MRAIRGIVWVALSLFVALAFVLTSWVPLLAVAVALVLMPLAGWLSVILAARRTTAAVSSAATVSKDAKVEIELELQNASSIPVAHARVALTARNLLTGEAEVLLASASIPPHGEVCVPVRLESEYCGRVSCMVESIRLYEPFRIFSRCVPIGAERRFTVMPRLYDVRLRDVYAASPLSDTTVFSPYVKGSDLSEVFALREYEEGDELKRIHWKLSEKIDRMIVRDASLPLDNALLLFWDKRIAVGESNAASRADTMAEVVLALMEQFVHSDATFEVASNDIPHGSCPRTFVTDEADIYEVIGQLLSSPIAVAEASGIEEYRRFYGNLTCSRLIYVCSEQPLAIETVLGTAQALLLVCDDDMDIVVRPQVSEIHFPAGGARMALEMVGAM